MSEFTQGTWKARNWDYNCWTVFDKNITIADCFCNKANAKLIAATPQLYNIVHALAECQPHQFSDLKLRAQEFLQILEGGEN